MMTTTTLCAPVFLGLALAACARSGALVERGVTSPLGGQVTVSSAHFEGAFEGTIYGDDESSASLTLNLVQRGEYVQGTATLGEGLRIDIGGGFCPGVRTMPARELAVHGRTPWRTPHQLKTDTSIVVAKRKIDVEIVGRLTPDKSTLKLAVRLETPFFCHNPELLASMSRVHRQAVL